MRRLKRILVTAGPTRERIDRVRFISNLSTGNMGYQIAGAAARRGFDVTLISGPTALRVPKGVKFIPVEGARQMEREVRRHFKASDCIFMASAVCDWRPENAGRGKMKKDADRLTLRLVRNPDILARLGKEKDGKLAVGFALESGATVKNAAAKLRAKNLDMIVANDIGGRTPFGRGRTDVTIIDSRGARTKISNATKARIAGELIDRAKRRWREKA